MNREHHKPSSKGLKQWKLKSEKKKSKTTASPLSCLRSRRLAWFSDILHTPNWVAPAHNPDTRCSSSRTLCDAFGPKTDWSKRLPAATNNFLKSALNKDACEQPRLAVCERRRAELQAEVQRGTKPRPSPFCSVTQQHGGEEGTSGRTGSKTWAALSSSAMAPKETGYKAALDATRLPNGQILPNIPQNSLFCVTLPASRMGRFCQTYHYTLSFALRYPLPERADSAKHTTTLIRLRYPTRFPNGQNISPHSFLCVTLPAAGTGRLGQNYYQTLSFALRYPCPEWADSAKHATTLFLLCYATRCPNGQILQNTLSFAFSRLV